MTCEHKAKVCGHVEESDNPHTPLSRAELFSGLCASEDTIARLRKQRAVLRREVRRLNEKVAAMSATIYWRLGAGKQLSHEVDRRLLDGPAMWALRVALGLSACEVSNADVIRAAARKLEKDADNG